MKRAILSASIVVASGVLFTNVYNSIVDARAWGADIPHSIATVRSYFQTVNPGDFFRVTSPLVQLLALLSLVVTWRAWKPLRRPLTLALVAFVLTDVMTFAYFYPRNAFMFKDAPLTDVAGLTRAWSEWSRANWIRTLLYLGGVILSLRALHRSYALGASHAVADSVPSAPPVQPQPGQYDSGAAVA